MSTPLTLHKRWRDDPTTTEGPRKKDAGKGQKASENWKNNKMQLNFGCISYKTNMGHSIAPQLQSGMYPMGYTAQGRYLIAPCTHTRNDALCVPRNSFY
jgi:hypothetical protein